MCVTENARTGLFTGTINRAYYQATGTAGIFPLEDEINLPQRGYSYFLQEISSKLAVNGSYEKACEVFADIFPVAIPIIPISVL
ncbi:MAG: hypothetical protein NTW27_14715 [Deltaproteobacteria bacterium]|nr:hypothetical protein [Deltaproteobacteria bacterium]